MTTTHTAIDLDELERKARAATPGMWQWFGNTKIREIYLATVDRGRVFIMDFVRWGMAGAQPRFGLADFDGGCMRSVGELGAAEHPSGPVFEVAYRRHFSGIGHPDAQHIAANSPPVTLGLIDRIRELEASLTNTLKSAHPNERDHPCMSAAWRAAEALLAKGAVLP